MLGLSSYTIGALFLKLQEGVFAKGKNCTLVGHTSVFNELVRWDDGAAAFDHESGGLGAFRATLIN
jgi:hypothetical protein